MSLVTSVEPIKTTWEQNAKALRDEGFEQARLTTSDWTVNVITDFVAMDTDDTWVEFATYADDDVITAILEGTILRMQVQDAAGNDISEDSLFQLVVRHNARSFPNITIAEVQFFPYAGVSFNNQQDAELNDAYALTFLRNVPKVVRLSQFETLALWVHLGSSADYAASGTKLELTVFQKRL